LNFSSQGDSTYSCVHVGFGVIIRVEHHALLRDLLVKISLACTTNPPRDAKSNLSKNKTSFSHHLLMFLFPADSANIDVICDPSGEVCSDSGFISLR
jgi:hypothetical protein